MAASGAPERSPHHAEDVADVALKMIQKMADFKAPSGNKVEIKIGKSISEEFIRSNSCCFSYYIFDRYSFRICSCWNCRYKGT